MTVQTKKTKNLIVLKFVLISKNYEGVSKMRNVKYQRVKSGK